MRRHWLLEVSHLQRGAVGSGLVYTKTQLLMYRPPSIRGEGYMYQRRQPGEVDEAMRRDMVLMFLDR